MLGDTRFSMELEEKVEIHSGEKDISIFLYQDKVKRHLSLEESFRLKEIWDNLTENIKSKFASTSFQEFTEDRENIFLEHERIAFISYPNEWCSFMFKDACLFHIQLFKDLLSHNFTFKDLHLWNILPEYNKFKFVDIPSIEKKFLATDNKENIDKLTWYFKYYLLMPLLGYAFGNNEQTKNHIFNTTLNASTHVMKLRDCISLSGGKYTTFKKMLSLLCCYSRFLIFERNKNKLTLHECISKFEKTIMSIPLHDIKSGYVSYYEQKGEMSDFQPNAEWNLKQRNIYETLNDEKINAVLDVGCNIGWYSILAAKLGKKVVSIDNDHACINALYKFSKSHNLNILPLCVSFDDLYTERYAPSNGKKVILSFVDRTQCDLVYVLGLIHHLILGLGYDMDELLNTFSKLAINKVVIEFVELDDEKIVNYPEFFNEYHKNPGAFSSYSLDTLLSKSKKYFNQFEILPSYPETRKLVVLTK